MKYYPPSGSTDPNASYVDRNTPGATAGSKVPAKAIETPQRELVALTTKSGFAASDTDVTQAAKAVRSQALNYRVAGGTANAITVALDPVVASHAETVGMPVRMRISTTNTGPATLDVGPGALPMKTMRGVDVAAGDLPVGSVVTVIGTGTSWLLTGLAYSEVPVQGAATIWVRTDGSDANDGGANTAGRALATIAAAVTRMKAYSVSSAVTIRLGNAGTYAAPAAVPCGFREVTIQGDVAAQDSYIIAGSLDRLVVGINGQLTIKGANVRNTGASTIAIAANGQGSVVNLEYVTISGTVAFSSIQMLAEGGQLNVGAGCKVAVGGGSAIGATNGGVLFLLADLNVTGTPAFTGGFAAAGQCSQVRRGALNPVVIGAATGQRYIVSEVSVISTNGGGANFFPGNAAGSALAGSYGVYA